jgi:hypothetical protein
MWPGIECEQSWLPANNRSTCGTTHILFMYILNERINLHRSKTPKRDKYMLVILNTICLPASDQQATSPLRCLTPQMEKYPFARLIILHPQNYNSFRLFSSIIIFVHFQNLYKVKPIKQKDTAAIPSRQFQ